jgi:hypothetical protein
MPVSSTIHERIAPRSSIAGRTWARTASNIAASLQGASAMKF